MNWQSALCANLRHRSNKHFLQAYNLNQNNARKLIEAFHFSKLFAEELFWNRLPTSVTLEANGKAFRLTGIAEKSGVQVFSCPPQEDGNLPPYALRQKIERALSREVREHLIIYANAAQTLQIWQWVAREPGKPAAMREIQWQRGTTADLLLEKLHLIAFRLEDDDTLLTVLDVAGKLRDAFDREKLTKRFYDSFKIERDAFTKFIDGIPDAGNQSWYTSVMINRLMFVYFLQRKPLPNGQFFLDNKYDYLRHHLNESKTRGQDRFYSDFLCPLFFHGFAQGDKRDEVHARFGDIPYLNGGLFARHPLEDQFGASIAIPDAAFEKLFDFFDPWDWHLDDRPITNTNGKEINPDVLGYIFEKYINQKQMGAYYTKEDITGYICRNTIVPFLLERMRERAGKAFTDSAWPLLQADPDRYIWPAMQKGADLPLPPEIADGIDTAQPNLIVRRKGWNRNAPDTHALPTEIWRETIARRERYTEVRNKLAQGQIHEVNDLITYNLDICQFAQDVIERSDDPAIVRALWRALVGVVPGVGESHREFEHGISILDPTCGSGAFLFAALNILEPLYHACLQRMRAWVLQADIDGDKQKYPDFRATLADVDHRANEKYFVYKSIIVNNLYGVDIMDEAVEIAKLRLFLKLVSQLSDKREIEPLPDIDFNIRAGNTLVGFATYDEVKNAVTHDASGQGKMQFDDPMQLIEDDAFEADTAFRAFREQQLRHHQEIDASAKVELKKKLNKLDERLNGYLAREYGIDTGKPKKLEAWKASHKPFHWFVDFYGIMKSGGFDVIVGNPPYIEYSKVKSQYELTGQLENFSGNLYAACLSRSNIIKSIRGFNSQIVPVSLPSTDRLQKIRNSLRKNHDIFHVSFSTRPQKLFDEAEQRLTVFIQAPSKSEKLLSGGYLKWNSENRSVLFHGISFVGSPSLQARKDLWPKTESNLAETIFRKIQSHNSLQASQYLSTEAKLFYKNTGLRYFNTVTRRPPKCTINGVPNASSRETVLNVSKQYLGFTHALLLSTTFFANYQWTTNCRDLNPGDIESFPVPLVRNPAIFDELSEVVERDYIKKSRVIVMNNKRTGKVELESLSPAKSKLIIDEIDIALGSIYGFRELEIDYILNYDIKYRLGAEAADD